MNPKDIVAAAEERCPLDLLEPTADEQIALALANGRDKYGLRNFTEPGNAISYRVYVAAIRRHVNALLRYEDVADDSGLHHLAHIGANVHVILAALEAGTLVDDRNPHFAAFAAPIEEAGRTPPPGVYDSACCHDPVVRCPACA